MNLDKTEKMEACEQNLHKNYERFKQSFNIYLQAAKLEDETDERKMVIYLSVAGEAI